jgi:RNA polymerase sigma factor (sigma-70 family)
MSSASLRLRNVIHIPPKARHREHAEAARRVGPLDFDVATGQQDERRRDDAMDLAQAMRRLPARTSMVLTETVMRGRSLDDVGGEIGVSRERVRQIRERGLKKLREFLGADVNAT